MGEQNRPAERSARECTNKKNKKTKHARTHVHAETHTHPHTHKQTNNERRHHSHPRSDRSAHQLGPPQPPQSVMWQSSLRKALVNNKNISQHVAPKGRNR